MKKIGFFVVILSLLLGINGFTQSQEDWFSLGFEWGNYFESSSQTGKTAKTYLSSPGIALGGYTFWKQKTIGLFVHGFILFPVESTITINGQKTTVNLSVYDFIMQPGFIIGPGVRVNINDSAKLHFGVGLDLEFLFAAYRQYTKINLLFGIGGDIGFKYDFTDGFYLDIGSILVYDFANHYSIKSSLGDTSGWANDYSLFSVRPYICIGFNFYNGFNFGKYKGEK